MVEVTRRELAIGGAAVLMVPVGIAVTDQSANVQTKSLAGGAALASAPAAAALGAYLKIDTANNVTLLIGSTEMGQGIMTGLAQLVAEELMLSWTQVRVEHALASAAWPNPFGNPLFGAQLTGGSTSMRGWYLPLRRAAAIARQTLLNAAEKQSPGGTWMLASGGRLTNGTTTYLFKDVVATAATLTPPTSVPLVTTNNVIGKSMARTDIPEKTTGAAVFGTDVIVPGMVFASVIHCPTSGGTVASAPTSASGALAVVNLGDSVGVIATDTWSAMRIAHGLQSKIKWTLPANLAARDSGSIFATAQTLLTSTTVTPHIYETTGAVDPAQALSGARAAIDATYHLPYLAHGCMEVLSATASVTATSCEIWAATQGQQFCIPTAQAITGLPASAITVHTTYLGGGLGRKIEQDYIAQVVKLAKAFGRPVKLIWSRTADFQNDKFRPCASIRVRAGVDANNGFNSLLYRNVSPSINIQRNTAPGNNPEDTGAVAGAVGLPYAIANRRIEFVPNPADIPLGYWRSVGESYNTFAVESAVDELAKAAGLDPLAFRKASVAANPRALGVLNAVEKLSGWSTTPDPAGNARGVAFLSGFGSFIALVAQVSLSSGKVKINKVFCAIDCGIAINPDSIEAQVQGGILHGISATLWGEVKFANGVPNVVNFSNYRVLRMSELPAISVTIIPSTEAPGGIGETGVPCVAPAIANALARLNGTRVRQLPFYPGATMGD